MNKQVLSGILPALMTAFGDDGIDKDKIKQHIKRLAAAGVNGFYVGGSSGEMVLCSVSERKHLLEAAVEAVDELGEQLAVIVHTGAMSTSDALDLTRHAAKTGATAVSSVTPLYYKYSFTEIKHYYEQLANASNLPVIIYNIPAITGTTLSHAQLSELLSIDNVGGMKFTSSDFFTLNLLTQEFPDKVFYNGSDEMLLSGLAAGADGGIGTTYNFIPRHIVGIYKNFCDGNIARAHELQSRANKIIDTVVRLGTLPASKYMIKLSGLDYGECREPFMPLTDTAKHELEVSAWSQIAEFEK